MKFLGVFLLEIVARKLIRDENFSELYHMKTELLRLNVFQKPQVP